MRARRDIHPGEELTVAYVDPTFPLRMRRRALAPWAFGTCMCERCVREEEEEKEGEKDKPEEEHGSGKAEEEEPNGEVEKYVGLEEELKKGLGLL